MNNGPALLLEFWQLWYESLVRIPFTLWYILPPFLIVVAWRVWLNFSQARYLKNLEWDLLEIKIPRELLKSPQAMEVVTNIFAQGNDGTFVDRWFKGYVRFWFSLEIASFGGEVHFYVRTPKKFRNAVESQLYSQYPDSEIFEVPDYTLAVPYGTKDSDWTLWAGTFKLGKEDFYPIKTYIDYGLDKDPKEELKVDPITPVIELFGSIGAGEQLWMQILVMDTKKRGIQGSLFRREEWKDAAKKELDKLQKRDQKLKEGDVPNPGQFTLTPQEKFVADAIARSLTKQGFDCGYRVVYLAKEDLFNPGMIMGLLGTIKQYNSPHLNSFKLDQKVGFDYPWQDLTGRRVKRQRFEMLDAFRKRSYFYAPYQAKPFVLTSEELATIYHYPGQVDTTPNLVRIESKRGEPPANLPI